MQPLTPGNRLKTRGRKKNRRMCHEVSKGGLRERNTAKDSQMKMREKGNNR